MKRRRRPAVVSAGVEWHRRALGLVTATLAMFGIAAVYGASSIVAVEQGQPAAFYALRQLLGVLVGGVALVIAARMDYHLWRRLAWPMILLAIAVLLIPFIPGLRALSPEINGARRWLRLGPFQLQPSEFAKFAVIAWCAMLAAKKGETIREFKRGILPFLAVVGPLSALILFQPNLSTATLVALLAGVVMFTAGAKIGHFLLLLVAAIPIGFRELTQVQYRLARVSAFFSAGPDTAQTGWQIQQSLIGMGAGGLIGVGFGEGLQKLGYLPLAYSDFIFSTIGEEWGFVGVGLVVLLYAIYVWMGILVARRAPDPFGMFLAAGITAMIGITAVLHMAVTLALVPTTGLPLPFVSFGRSALLVSLFATGVLINVGRQGARAG
ncbi:MAG TPA: putative peptidoglycan glycosyltransferase FtsW [Gemmatimonadales bacterium]